MMKVTYLGHSGFLAELENAYLLFDYYKGTLPELKAGKRIYVFISHAHYDHFRKDIFTLREYFTEVYFILPDDVEPDGGDGITMVGANEELEVQGCKIRTLRSNDEGVAFLVQFEEDTVYHAGDLNWWHWEEESKAYNTRMRREYQHEVNKLQGIKIDVAFVPVDPRLKEQYFWGLDCFMKRTDTQAVFPMHFWDNYGIFDRLMIEKGTEEYADKIQRISRQGQMFELKKIEEKSFADSVREFME